MASRVLFVFLVISVIYDVCAAPADEASPPALDCPNENERYEECGLAYCYKNCKHLIQPPACPSIASPCIDPVCLCKEGYLRNKDGVCVATEKCEEYSTQQMMFSDIGAN